MRQLLARTLILTVMLVSAACGAQPTATPTLTSAPAATLTPAPAAATATLAPTTAPTDGPPIPTLPPPATSAPTEAPLLTPPGDPCTDSGVSLAGDLMLSYTSGRSDGLGESIYLVRADGTQPAEFVQGALAPSWSPNGQRLAYLTNTDDPARPYALHLILDDGSAAQDVPLDAAIDADQGLRWSPDGHYLALGGQAGVYVVDAHSGGVVNVAGDLPAAWGPVWSPDSTRVAFQAPLNVALNNEYRVYTALPDGSDRVLVASDTLNDFVQSWVADGSGLIVRAGADAAGPQQVYRVSTDGATRERLFGDQSYADRLALSPNGQRLAYLAYQLHVDEDGLITGQTQWLVVAEANGANPHTLQQVELGYGEAGLSVPYWSPNGRYLAFNSAVAEADPGLYVIDICTDAPTKVAGGASELLSWKAGPPLANVTLVVASPAATEPPVATTDAATQLAWTPDGLTLAAATTAGVRFFDAATGAATTLLPAASACCGLSAFGAQYLARITPGGTGLTVVDWQTQQVVFALSDQPIDQIQSVAISPDGTRLATGERFQVRLYELPSGNLLTPTLQTADVADSYVTALGFTADGGALVSVTQWEGAVHVWDVGTLTLRRTFRIPTVTVFTLTPGARQVAADYAKPGFDLYEPATGFLLGRHPKIIGAGGPGFTAFSQDNRRVAVWGFKTDNIWTMAVWDVANDRLLNTFNLDASAMPTNEWRSAAFSPDGARLAVSDAAGNLWLYDTTTWAEAGHWAVPGSVVQP